MKSCQISNHSFRTTQSYLEIDTKPSKFQQLRAVKSKELLDLLLYHLLILVTWR